MPAAGVPTLRKPRSMGQPFCGGARGSKPGVAPSEFKGRATRQSPAKWPWLMRLVKKTGRRQNAHALAAPNLERVRRTRDVFRDEGHQVLTCKEIRNRVDGVGIILLCAPEGCSSGLSRKAFDVHLPGFIRSDPRALHLLVVSCTGVAYSR